MMKNEMMIVGGTIKQPTISHKSARRRTRRWDLASGVCWESTGDRPTTRSCFRPPAFSSSLVGTWYCSLKLLSYSAV